MKTKELLYRVFYVISILLMVGFCIRLGVDWFTYDASLNSAPFYIFVFMRAVTFLLPALCSFIAAKLIKRKTK